MVRIHGVSTHANRVFDLGVFGVLPALMLGHDKIREYATTFPNINIVWPMIAPDKFILGEPPGKMTFSNRLRHPLVVLQSPDEHELPIPIVRRHLLTLLMGERGPIPIIVMIQGKGAVISTNVVSRNSTFLLSGLDRTKENFIISLVIVCRFLDPYSVLRIIGQTDAITKGLQAMIFLSDICFIEPIHTRQQSARGIPLL
jgi:hypothetical protein